MKTPPLLLGIALLFWGLQTGFTLFAAIMAVILEMSRLIKARWEFSEKEYNRIFDLCGLLLVGAGAIATTSEEVRVPALTIAQWFPFIFYPIMLAQTYGSREKLTMRTLNWFFLRRRKTGLANKELNISYLYFALCLLSASASSPNRRSAFPGPLGTEVFYLGISTLLVFAFFAMRSRRVHGVIWVTMIACVAALGQVGHLGLSALQRQLESAVAEWMGRFGRLEFNQMESQTAIGRIGELKLSDKIVLRVEPENGSRPPGLLRQVSYETYDKTVWRATNQQSGSVNIDIGDTWKLIPDAPVTSAARISGHLYRGAGILAVPTGLVELQELAVGSLNTNRLGMAKVETGPRFIRFLAKVSEGVTFDAPPVEGDFQVPDVEEAVLEEIVDQLGLSADIPVQEKLRLIHKFFQDNFSYATYITSSHVDETGRKTPIEIFLKEVRSGHCEYFATAAVLLARKAGIPARYATGFAVQETSGIGDMYVVRERHAHAWALVYRNGAWQDFDTTPASWDEIEGKNTPSWQPLKDLWSRLGYEFSKWRYSETKFQQYALWLLIPLGGVLIWRIVFNKKRKRAVRLKDSNIEIEWPGLDSELYQIEEELGRRGLLRKPSEPLYVWRERVMNAAPLPAKAFDIAVDLHARYRFDPQGLDGKDRELLRVNVAECLQLLRSVPRNQATPAESNSHAG